MFLILNYKYSSQVTLAVAGPVQIIHFIALKVKRIDYTFCYCLFCQAVGIYFSEIGMHESI